MSKISFAETFSDTNIVWNCDEREYNDDLIIRDQSDLLKCNQRLICKTKYNNLNYYYIDEYKNLFTNYSSSKLLNYDGNKQIKSILLNPKGESFRLDWRDFKYFYKVNDTGYTYKATVESILNERPKWELKSKPIEGLNEIKLVASSGASVYSYYFLPFNYNKNKKHKLLVMFHGGNFPFQIDFLHDEDYILKSIQRLREKGYIVLLVNHEGKDFINYDLSRISYFYPHALSTTTKFIYELTKRVNLSGEYNLMGCSNGGYMSALFASHARKFISNNYKLNNVFVNSGVFNNIDGFFNYIYDYTDDLPNYQRYDWVAFSNSPVLNFINLVI